MASFKSTIITQKGHNLMAKLSAGTATMSFTKIKSSDHDYSALTSSQLEALVSIDNIKQEVLVNEVTRINDASVKVSGSILNTSLTIGYYIKTIALYANDPDEGEILYSITVANESDWMPPYNNVSSASILIDLITVVSNAENVTIDVDPNAIVTITQFNEFKDKVDASLSDMENYLENTTMFTNFPISLKNENTINVAGVDYLKTTDGFKLKVSNGAFADRYYRFCELDENNLKRIKYIKPNNIYKFIGKCYSNANLCKLKYDIGFYVNGSWSLQRTDVENINKNTWISFEKDISIPNNATGFFIGFNLSAPTGSEGESFLLKELRLSNCGIVWNQGYDDNKDVLSKKLRGVKRKACVLNINNTGFLSGGIMGIDVGSQLATYPNRDHALVYRSFSAEKSMYYVPYNFTSKSVQVDKSFVDNIDIGSVINCFDDQYKNCYQYSNNLYSGLVVDYDYNTNTIYVDGWYKKNNTTEGQIPSNVNWLLIDVPSAGWVENDVLRINEGSATTDLVCKEIDVFNDAYYKDKVNRADCKCYGVDIVTFTGRLDTGYRVRKADDSKENTEIWTGFHAKNCIVGFRAEGNTQYDFYGNNGIFKVGINGEQYRQVYNTKEVLNGTNLNPDAYINYAKGSFTVSLPDPSTYPNTSVKLIVIPHPDYPGYPLTVLPYGTGVIRSKDGDKALMSLVPYRCAEFFCLNKEWILTSLY